MAQAFQTAHPLEEKQYPPTSAYLGRPKQYLEGRLTLPSGAVV